MICRPSGGGMEINMYVIRYSIAIVSGLLALIIILTQWLAIIRYMINRKEHFSLMPLAGGIFLCISFAVMPGNSYWWLCWVALFLDPGCLPMAIGALIYSMKHKKK